MYKNYRNTLEQQNKAKQKKHKQKTKCNITQKTVNPKPEWNDTIKDDSNYKLSATEIVQKKISLMSKHRLEAKEEWLERQDKLRKGVNDEETKKIYNTAKYSKNLKTEEDEIQKNNLSQMLNFIPKQQNDVKQSVEDMNQNLQETRKFIQVMEQQGNNQDPNRLLRVMDRLRSNQEQKLDKQNNLKGQSLKSNQTLPKNNQDSKMKRSPSNKNQKQNNKNESYNNYDIFQSGSKENKYQMANYFNSLDKIEETIKFMEEKIIGEGKSLNKHTNQQITQKQEFICDQELQNLEEYNQQQQAINYQNINSYNIKQNDDKGSSWSLQKEVDHNQINQYMNYNNYEIDEQNKNEINKFDTINLRSFSNDMTINRQTINNNSSKNKFSIKSSQENDMFYQQNTDENKIEQKLNQNQIQTYLEKPKTNQSNIYQQDKQAIKQENDMNNQYNYENRKLNSQVGCDFEDFQSKKLYLKTNNYLEQQQNNTSSFPKGMLSKQNNNYLQKSNEYEDEDYFCKNITQLREMLETTKNDLAKLDINDKCQNNNSQQPNLNRINQNQTNEVKHSHLNASQDNNYNSNNASQQKIQQNQQLQLNNLQLSNSSKRVDKNNFDTMFVSDTSYKSMSNNTNMQSDGQQDYFTSNLFLQNERNNNLQQKYGINTSQNRDNANFTSNVFLNQEQETQNSKLNQYNQKSITNFDIQRKTHISQQDMFRKNIQAYQNQYIKPSDSLSIMHHLR